MWPDMGQVEDNLLLLLQLLGLCGSHGLHFQRPLRVVTASNSLAQVLLSVIGRLGRGFLLNEELGALLGFHVELAVDPLSLLVDEINGVA